MNNLVHGLWIGKISPLELLTTYSFLDHGAEFWLWTYNEPKGMTLPSEVIIKDGNEILPKDKIFLYPDEMVYGKCNNTVVGFSEWFRYKVLYEYGGWWSDMDVTCLKPLDLIDSDYFFRTHGILSVVGNIIKCPPKSELMRLCFAETETTIDEHTDDMYEAIRILGYYVKFLDLEKYIRKNICPYDEISIIDPFYSRGDYDDGQTSAAVIPDEWHFIHWMHSFIKNTMPKAGSVFCKLLEKYDIQQNTIPL